jgi:hypothetical protein
MSDRTEQESDGRYLSRLAGEGNKMRTSPLLAP